MSNERYLWHTTLQTGDSRKSYRSEVADDVIPHLREWLHRMQEGERVEILPGYWCSGRISGRCATFSVFAGTELILAFGVAEHARCGAALWRGLHNAEGLPWKTDPETQPQAPWIGVALTDAFHAHPGAWDWVGDFERCLGWALLEEK